MRKGKCQQFYHPFIETCSIPKEIVLQKDKCQQLYWTFLSLIPIWKVVRTDLNLRQKLLSELSSLEFSLQSESFSV